MRDTFRLNDDLIVETAFHDFLASSNCRIAALFKSFRTIRGINYIGVTDKIDTISYLPESKIEYVENNGIDPFSDKIGRVNLKVGRLVFKCFKKEIVNEYVRPTDIEDFVNQFKSFFDLSNRRFEVVSGKDIKKWYLDRNYLLPDYGTLWKSCMRYHDRQPFLELYCVNPDKIKMLVLFSTQDGVEKVRARAILWDEVEDMNDNKLKIMDRIYTIYDSDILMFKNWAKENGYIPKFYQNAKSQNLFDINGERVKLNLKVTLQQHKLEYYPYLDSFQFYDCYSGIFYNNDLRAFDYTLIQANGSLTPPDPEPERDDFDDSEFDSLLDDQEW